MDVEAQSGCIVSTHLTKGAVHEVALFKHTPPRWRHPPSFIADKGYAGLPTLGFRALIPFKKTKHRSLTPEQNAFNREISRRHIPVEHVFAALKTFNILGTRYRNRRRRLILRFNWLAGLYNYQLINK